jgi:hypothetical protein
VSADEPAPPPGSILFEVTESDSHHALGATRGLVIAVWRRETRLDALDKLSALIAERAEQDSSLALLQVVESNAVPPESAVRAALSALLRRHDQQLSCSAVVFEGEGFRAAALRGVVTAIGLLSRPRFPHEVFATPLAGIQWIAKQHASRDPKWMDEAGRAVTALRAAIAGKRTRRSAV